MGSDPFLGSDPDNFILTKVEFGSSFFLAKVGSVTGSEKSEAGSATLV